MRQRRTSGVYIVQQEGPDGPVKIGHGDVGSRLRTLQTGNGRELRLLRVLEGGRAEEEALHKRFAMARRRGEWFDPEPILEAFGIDAEAVWNGAGMSVAEVATLNTRERERDPVALAMRRAEDAMRRTVSRAGMMEQPKDESRCRAPSASCPVLPAVKWP